MFDRGVLPIELLDAFGLGVYLLFGILHFDLWLRRRERHSHLWLATASAAALAIDVTGMILRATGAAPTPFIINLLGVALAVVSIGQLVAAVAGRPWGRAIRTLQVVSLLAAPFAATLQVVTPLFFVLNFFLLIAADVRAIASARAGERESRATAIGVMVLIATLLADLLMELGVLPQVSGLPILGFTFLFLFVARALNARYEREHGELGALRATLETRVRQRTEELEEANRRLEEMSRTDALTGLANRRGFVEASAQEMTRARRSGKPWSVLIADLDEFKKINDRHGHAAGDDALRETAAILRRAVRAQDLAGRWGGEEFVLLLPETTATGAMQAAETIRQAVESHAFGAFPLTISIGVAEHRGEETLEMTIAAADRALYRAKEGGRNRVIADGSDHV